MKHNLLGAVAAFAFVATGLAAQSQESPRQDNKGVERAPATAPHAEMNAPKERNEGAKAEGQPGGAMKRNEGAKAAEGERRDQNAAEPGKDAPKQAQSERKGENGAKPKNEPAKAAEGERRETDGPARKDATRADAPRNDAPKAAQVEKRGAPDVARPNNAGDGKSPRTVTKGEPRVNGVKISTEHAARIGETLRRGGRSERPNFEIRVGVRVPTEFQVRPLPREIVEIEPEYRGYDYFIDAEDEIVFVSPETHEIVGTISYEGRAAAIDAPRAARPCPPED